jgi:hypothetical protein
MATYNSYTLNGPDLLSATTIFGPSPATTVAPDGYYSDGTTVRQQVSGVLQPDEACPNCFGGCDVPIVENSGNLGIFKTTVDVGTGTTGALVITFQVYGVPDGIFVNYNGNDFNEFSSPNFGYMNTGVPTNLPVYIGRTSAWCDNPPGSGIPISPCVAPCTALSALPIYNYNFPAFVDSGTTGAVTILATQDATTATTPGKCVMIVPKNAISSSVDVTVYGVCASTVWDVTVGCAAALPSTATTGFDAADPATACTDATATTLYRGKVNGTDALPGYYDWVFTDNQGVTQATTGFYKYDDGGVNKWFWVTADGVIGNMGNC